MEDILKEELETLERLANMYRKQAGEKLNEAQRQQFELKIVMIRRILEDSGRKLSFFFLL